MKGDAVFMKDFSQSDLNANPKGGNQDDEEEEEQYHQGRHQQRGECPVQ